MFKGQIHAFGQSALHDTLLSFGIDVLDGGAELASAPFQTHDVMTQIAMAERPSDFIGDLVLPRVNAPFKFQYSKAISADQFTIPETRASRAGRLNEQEFGQELADGSCDDHGLIAYVPDRDIREARQQNSAWDPLMEASAGLGQLMALAREKRVADIAFTDTNYPTGHRMTLAGDTQWSHVDSNPVDAILAALDECITRPNTMVIGQKAWTKFRQHDAIIKACMPMAAVAGADSSAGAVSRAAVAEFFELDRVLVGRTWNQTANRGQDEAYGRLWGKHCALLHIRRPTGTRDAMPTWGFTPQAMALQTATSMEPSRGIGRGSTAVKVSECLREIISWNTAAYFFKNAVA